MRRALAVFSSCAFLFVLPTMVQAATFTWANLGADWGTAANWGGSSPAGADVGQFNLPGYSAQPNVGELNTIGGVWDTGAGALNVTGTSTLTINGTTISGNANTGIELDPSAGSMSVSAAIALGGSQQWFNNSSNALTVTGPLSLGFNNNLTFSGDGQTNVSAPIFGQGNVAVGSGANVLFSTGSAATANSYLGTTQINGGLLTLQGPAGSILIPGASPLSLSSGGTLNLNGISSTFLQLTSSDPTSQLLLGAGTVTLGGPGSNTVFGGAISGNGGVTKTGANTVTLAGTNSYLGATTVSAGMLQISGGSALSSASPIFVASATPLNYLNDGSGNNGTISQGNNITLTAATTATINVGNLTANTGNTVAFGVLSASTTSGFTFTAANNYKQSYSGLNLSTSNTGQTFLIPTTATVSINGPVNYTIAAPVAGKFDTLFLQGTSSGNQISGSISDAAGFTSVGNGDTRITANGTGQWILSGTNTYHGPTTLSSGSLEFAGNSSLPAATTVTFNTTSAASLQVRTDATGIGSTLSLGNNISLTAATAADTIDVGSLSGTVSNVTVAFGTLANNAGANVVTINVVGKNNYIANFTQLYGAGSTGANTFLNPTTGNVIIGNAATVTGTNVINQLTSNSGFETFYMNGTSGPNANGLGNIIYGAIADRAGYVSSTSWLHGETNLTVNGGTAASGGNYGNNGFISPSGSAIWTLAGTNTYSGWTTVDAGTLQLGTGLAGQDGVIPVSAVTAQAHYNIVGDYGALVYNLAGNQVATYSVSGTGILIKKGANSDVTLTGGSNGYTGTTTISAGTLQLGNGGATGAITASSGIVNNGFLAFDQSNTVTYANAISGGGTLAQIGAGGTVNITAAISGGQNIRVNTGTMTLSGADTFNGATSVTGGTLNMNSAANSTPSINVSGGQLNLNASANGATNISVSSGQLFLNAPTLGATTISVSGISAGDQLRRLRPGLRNGNRCQWRRDCACLHRHGQPCPGRPDVQQQRHGQCDQPGQFRLRASHQHLQQQRPDRQWGRRLGEVEAQWRRAAAIQCELPDTGLFRRDSGNRFQRLCSEHPGHYWFAQRGKLPVGCDSQLRRCELQRFRVSDLDRQHQQCLGHNYAKLAKLLDQPCHQFQSQRLGLFWRRRGHDHGFDQCRSDALRSLLCQQHLRIHAHGNQWHLGCAQCWR